MTIEESISKLIVQEIAVNAVVDYLVKDPKYLHFGDTRDPSSAEDGYEMARINLEGKIREIIGR